VEIDYKPIIIALFIGFHLAEILAGVFWNKDKIRRDDVWIEVIGTSFYMIIAAPLIFYAGPALTEVALPRSENSWAGLTWWQMLIILLIVDEGLHYWWHRLTHEIPWMYNLHRAHHSCQYMSVRLAFRNNLFYFLMMPSVWASAVLLHLGFGPVLGKKRLKRSHNHILKPGRKTPSQDFPRLFAFSPLYIADIANNNRLEPLLRNTLIEKVFR